MNTPKSNWDSQPAHLVKLFISLRKAGYCFGEIWSIINQKKKEAKQKQLELF